MPTERTAQQAADLHRPGTTILTDSRCFGSDNQLARVTWEGPVSEEGSWGERSLSDAAQCEVELFLSQSGGLYATVSATVGSTTHHEWVGLDLANGRKHVTGYEGVMSMPPQVLLALEACGFTYDADLC